MPQVGFDPDGYLPLGPFWGDYEGETVYCGHDLTMAQIQTKFVDEFHDSVVRPQIMMEIRNLLAVAERFVDCFTLLISGRFITDEQDASGVDLGLIVHPGSIEPVGSFVVHRMFDEKQWMIAEGRATVRTSLCREWPSHDDDAKRAYAREKQAILRAEAGETIPDRPTGYLELFVCPEGVIDVAEIEGVPGPGNPRP